jgi:Ca-activated chloride channel family protein
MGDVEFAEPYALFLALAVLPIAATAWWPRREGVVVASGSGVRHLAPTLRLRLSRWLPALLRSVAIVLLAIGAAGPRVGDANAVVPAEGIDIALSIDTSSSMTSSFVRSGGEESLDRLQATQDVVREFIAGLENDRVGLVIFAETSLAMSPPTLDYRALDEIVADLESGTLPDGTAIGLGISEAVNMLEGSTAASRVIILLTDGQQNEDSLTPQAAAGIAAALNMKLYTIGVVEDGARGSQFQGVDAELLETIAEGTGGRYFEADSPEELADVYEEIGQLEKSGVGRERFERFSELIPWFVMPAAVLLVAEMLLRATWLRRHPS